MSSGSATIDASTGTLTAQAEGSVTVTATVGSVTGSTGLTILDSVPAVVIDTVPLTLFSHQSSPITTSATVTDDQDVLSGGVLRLSLDPNQAVTDATFNIPATTLGTVTANGSSVVTLSLNSAASPEAVANLLFPLIRPLF